MATGVDATKAPARPSHESIPEERLDDSAMEMAKRAEKRIKDDDKDQIPGDSIFTK